MAPAVGAIVVLARKFADINKWNRKDWRGARNFVKI